MLVGMYMFLSITTLYDTNKSYGTDRACRGTKVPPGLRMSTTLFGKRQFLRSSNDLINLN